MRPVPLPSYPSLPFFESPTFDQHQVLLDLGLQVDRHWLLLLFLLVLLLLMLVLLSGLLCSWPPPSDLGCGLRGERGLCLRLRLLVLVLRLLRLLALRKLRAILFLLLWCSV
jgi:hypothetical protein